MYKQERDYENLQKALFSGVGSLQIPEISPVEYDPCRFIPFNYAAKNKKGRGEVGIHFYVDDYQFVRLWRYIDRYVPMLRDYKVVLSPDFSLFTDFPMALQIYNHYRKHWAAAYLQMNGVNVIPTISWSTADSYRWCFDGEPRRSCVSVSSVGTQNSKTRKELFVSGYKRMLEILEPSVILFHGSVPEDLEGNIIELTPFYKEQFEGR